MTYFSYSVHHVQEMPAGYRLQIQKKRKEKTIFENVSHDATKWILVSDGERNLFLFANED